MKKLKMLIGVFGMSISIESLKGLILKNLYSNAALSLVVKLIYLMFSNSLFFNFLVFFLVFNTILFLLLYLKIIYQINSYLNTAHSNLYVGWKQIKEQCDKNVKFGLKSFRCCYLREKKTTNLDTILMFLKRLSLIKKNMSYNIYLFLKRLRPDLFVF